MTQRSVKRIRTKNPYLTQPERTLEGFVLVDEGDRWSWTKFALQLIILVVWNWFAVTMLIFTTSQFLIAPMLLSGIFTVLGIAGTVWLVGNVLMLARLTPGEIILPQFPLRLGEGCLIRYRRELRQGRTTRQAGQVSAKLICYERVEYSVGTDHRHDIHTVYEQDIPIHEVSAGSSKISYDCPIRIPPNAPPSFEAPDNQIRWELRVSLNLPGAKDTSTFKLTVDPEVIG